MEKHTIMKDKNNNFSIYFYLGCVCVCVTVTIRMAEDKKQCLEVSPPTICAYYYGMKLKLSGL